MNLVKKISFLKLTIHALSFFKVILHIPIDGFNEFGFKNDDNPM